ncbi:Calcitonin-related peptide type 1 receptor-like protein, partial [Leptotrombidium deliense]
FCRNEAGIYSTQKEFEIDACARCYNYIPKVFFTEKLRYIGTGLLLNTSNNETLFANQTSSISQTFLSSSLTLKWQQCCKDAIQCCDQFLGHSLNDTQKEFTSKTQKCSRTWDGWTCWSSDVSKGTEVRQLCPDHIYWHQVIPSCRGYVTKKCDENGEWFQVDSKEWSNYSSCARDDKNQLF